MAVARLLKGAGCGDHDQSASGFLPTGNASNGPAALRSHLRRGMATLVRAKTCWPHGSIADATDGRSDDRRCLATPFASSAWRTLERQTWGCPLPPKYHRAIHSRHLFYTLSESPRLIPGL